ncbi:uncharacterized protein [Chanodichthys erythropterus]|uniref:uncharacterized protein isoform X2 n=1 Tax=Chanodichthys erythropterus TaxID=933992 RepID=UPI00351E9443
MIQLLNLCTFYISVSLGVMTELSGHTELTCCDRDQNISQCFFYAESRKIGHDNSSDHCCKLTVNSKELLKEKGGEELRTTITVNCTSKPGNRTSQDVTITVWRLSVFRFVFLVILGTLTLLSLLTFIIFICIICKTKNQENKQNQSANSGTVEVLEEKTEIVEDELLYATVNHSAAGENSAPTVKYESGTDYATVVIH